MSAFIRPLKGLIAAKDRGGAHFKKAEFDTALDLYLGVAADAQPDIAWPQVEEVVMACLANAALCCLKLQRPADTIIQCDKALALPSAGLDESMLAKVLLRKLQATIDTRQPGAALKVFDEVMARGLLDTAVGGKFLEEVARLSPQALRLSITPCTGQELRLTLSRPAEDAHRRAFDVVCAHWLATRRVTQVEVDAKTADVANGAESACLALCSLSTHLEEHVPIDEAITLLFDSAFPPVEVLKYDDSHLSAVVQLQYTFAAFLWGVPKDGTQRPLMRPSSVHAVDRDGGGHLVWALGNAYEMHYTKDVQRCTEAFIGLLEVLVRAGANVNHRQKGFGRTALMYVVRTGNVTAVTALLEAGASLHLRDTEGWTPLMCCCQNDVVPEEEGGPTADARAACCTALINAGARLDDQNAMGSTALIVACSNPPQLALVQRLVDAGARTDLSAGNGLSALQMLSRKCGDKDRELAHQCTKVIVGANPDTMTQYELQAIELLNFLNDELRPTFNKFAPSKEDQQLGRLMQDGIPYLMWRSGGPMSAEMRHFMKIRCRQEHAVCQQVMGLAGVAPEALLRPLERADGNWYEQVHSYVMARIPPPFRKVFFDQPPTEREMQLFAATAYASDRQKSRMENADGVRHYDEDIMRQVCLIPACGEHRGQIASLHRSLDQMIINPFTHTVCFAVPNEAALDCIARYAPIVEVGAGSGYWAALLRQRGVDVVAYDAEPPTEEHNNRFCDFTFGPVIKGVGEEIFVQDRALCSKALLLMWPTSPELPSTWDVDCLERYCEGGGQIVIYVGERSSNVRVVQGAPSDPGLTATRPFQQFLHMHFYLLEQVAIPNWGCLVDDLTVWKKKAPFSGQAAATA